MWNVGEKTLISIGEPLSTLSFLRTTENDLDLVEILSCKQFFNDIPPENMEIPLIIIQFDGWGDELIKVINFYKNKQEIKFLIIFENQEEFKNNYEKMNSINSFSLLKNDLLLDQIQELFLNLSILASTNEFMTASNLEITTNVNVPVSLEAISKDFIIIQKPTFSREIEQIDFDLKLNHLHYKANSKDKKIEFSDNKIIIKDNFSDIIERLKNYDCESVPFIKIAIFSKKISADIEELYSLPNISINLYRKATKSDEIFDLIIINEIYIENQPFSDEVIRELALSNQKIVVFNAKSTSRAYKKVYNYKKILLHQSVFSITTIKDLIHLTQQSIPHNCYFINERESIGLAQITISGTITQFNEIGYKLNLPISLCQTSIVTPDFWVGISGDTVLFTKEKDEYSHSTHFTNLTENQSNDIRKLLNKIISFQNNSKEKLDIKYYNEIPDQLVRKPEQTA
jgi:hypothetical protein